MKKIKPWLVSLLFIAGLVQAGDHSAEHEVIIDVPMMIGVEVLTTESTDEPGLDAPRKRRTQYRIFHNDNASTMKISVSASSSGKNDLIISGKIETPVATTSQSIGILEIIDGKVNQGKSIDAVTNIYNGIHQFNEFNYELPEENIATVPVTITYTICN